MKTKIGGILALSLLNSMNANASLYDFDSGLADFQVFGDASLDIDKVKLTSTSGNASGAIFLNNTINATNFIVGFDLFIGNGSGADGLTFAWVETAGLGSTGGGLGFSGLSGYSVEFDTYTNPGDISENHIGVNHNNVSSLSAISVPELEDTGWHHIDITFDSGDIQIEMDNVEYINYVIPGYTDFDAYFGFTAANGGLTNEHYVDNFSIETSAVPIPAAVWLFGSGVFGLIGMRKKSLKNTLLLD